MSTTESQVLLLDYAQSGSETAFGELVSRYLNLVYSVALRRVSGDAHLAEDVAQTVFTDLARKGRSLPPDIMLGGWLHRHTCFVASTVMRRSDGAWCRLVMIRVEWPSGRLRPPLCNGES
ncbi:MAG TPA: sigma factor [Verrucomicrobiae bacterium]|nr:sigma factor [Verrucomicrobiae bacterium]